MTTATAQCCALRSRIAWFLAAALLWIAGFLIFVLITPILSDRFGLTTGRIASSAVCLAAAFGSIYLLTHLRLNLPQALVLMAASVLVNFSVDSLFPALAARMLVGLTVITIGYSVGAIISGMVESPRYVLPICLVAAVADVWSVYSGPTKKILESKAVVAVKQHAFVAFPSPDKLEKIQPVAGIADLVFVALFMCIAVRLALNVHKSSVGMFLGLIVGIAVAGMIGGAPGIPFLAVGFLAASWRDVRPGKKELLTTFAFMVVMLLVFGAIRMLR